MIDTFLFLSAIFLSTFVIGRIIEKIRVPWIFAPLLIGAAFSTVEPVKQVMQSDVFELLSQLGMYFLLFLIGFKMDLKEFKKSSGFIIKSMVFIIATEAIIIGTLIHTIFGYSWFVSFLVSISFATVGEAILIPILEEFKIIKTKIGQAIIGIATLDNIIEIIILLLSIGFVSTKTEGNTSIALIILSLSTMFILTMIFTKFKNASRKFNYLNVENLFVLVLFVIFLFIGIGETVMAAPIGALLAGLSINNFVPKKRLKTIENEIKTMSYGFFAPIFFMWVGVTMDLKYLIQSPLLIIFISSASVFSKLFSSYITGRKIFGFKKSMIIGLSLSMRFSTSIIVVSILLKNNIINNELYSIILATIVVFKFIIPVILSNLLQNLKISRTNA